MSSPANSASDLPELDRAPAPDMIAELGPLAYGLFALSESGPLAEVRTLADSRAAHIPAQAERTPNPEARSEALLDELGELDF